MFDELDALAANGTWTLTIQPLQKKALGYNGYTRSSLNLIEPLNDIRPDLSFLETLKLRGRIIQRPSSLLLNWSLFRLT